MSNPYFTLVSHSIMQLVTRRPVDLKFDYSIPVLPVEFSKVFHLKTGPVDLQLWHNHTILMAAWNPQHKIVPNLLEEAVNEFLGISQHKTGLIHTDTLLACATEGIDLVFNPMVKGPSAIEITLLKALAQMENPIDQTVHHVLFQGGDASRPALFFSLQRFVGGEFDLQLSMHECQVLLPVKIVSKWIRSIR